MLSIPKQDKIRSKKLRDSARGEYCTLRIPGVCNNDPETTVLAHLRGNKGTSTKNHDLFAVYACSCCHDWMDGRRKGPITPVSISGEIAQMKALQETQLKFIDKKLIEVK